LTISRPDDPRTRLPSIVFAHAPRGMALPRGGAFDEFEDFPAQ